MPKAKAPKPAPVGLSVDTKLYKSGVTMYRLLRDGEVILESSKAETRDRVLEAMQARELAKLPLISA